MDKEINKLIKSTKKLTHEEESLRKADKKRDKLVSKGKKAMKKKGC
jgi:hypothetical protein